MMTKQSDGGALTHGLGAGGWTKALANEEVSRDGSLR